MKRNSRQKEEQALNAGDNPPRSLKLAEKRPNTLSMDPVEKRNLFGNILRTKKQKRFLFLAHKRDDLRELLETIYVASLLRKRNGNFHFAVLSHPANGQFLEQTGLFDSIILTDGGTNTKDEITAQKATVLYNPDTTVRGAIETALTAGGIRIHGCRKNPLSRLFRIRHPGDPSDLRFLKKRGIDLTPEYIAIDLHIPVPDRNPLLKGKKYIWLSLFDSHILSGTWPMSHAARLGRLLEQHNMHVAVPVHPNSSPEIEENLRYLQQSASSIIILRDFVPQDRVYGMMHAEAIVALAGPETLLASILKKPVFLLHDMRSQHIYNDTKGLRLLDSSEQLPPIEKKKDSEHGIPLLFRIQDSQEKHLKPSVLECINECSNCAFSSCLDHISPERIYEKLKNHLFPFSKN